MTGNEFKRRLDRLGSEISRGLVYYSVWEALWPTEETVRIIDRAEELRQPHTRRPLRDCALAILKGNGQGQRLPKPAGDAASRN